MQPVTYCILKVLSMTLKINPYVPGNDPPNSRHIRIVNENVLYGFLKIFTKNTPTRPSREATDHDIPSGNGPAKNKLEKQLHL